MLLSLDQDGIQKHQSLVGAIQWDVSLEGLCINEASMTLASFRAEPIEGRLDRARRVVSCLVKFKHANIRICTKEPDLSSAPVTPCEWEEPVHGKVTELLPQDAPAPKGKRAATVSHHETNLHHNFVAGR